MGKIIFTLFVFLTVSTLNALELSESYHLLTKTGFSPSHIELKTIWPLSKQEAVDEILKNVVQRSSTPPPSWLTDFEKRKKMMKYRDSNLNLYKTMLSASEESLSNWWIDEMIATSSPITEKMTMFWHKYFKSNLSEVSDPYLIFELNKLYRENAFGYFPVIFDAVVKNEGFLLPIKRKSKQYGYKENKQLVQRLVQTLEINPQKYSAKEIFYLSRLFSKWMSTYIEDKKTARTIQNEQGHLTQLFGETKLWQSEQALRALSSQETAHKNLIRLLWSEFVGEEVTPSKQKKLLLSFQSTGFHIKSLIRAILMSEEFWKTTHYQNAEKSPVEFTVGLIRQLDIRTLSLPSISLKIRKMGQRLLKVKTTQSRYFSLESELKAKKRLVRMTVQELANKNNTKLVHSSSLDAFLSGFSLDSDTIKTRKIAASILLGTTKFDPQIIASKNNKKFLISIFFQPSYLTK